MLRVAGSRLHVAAVGVADYILHLPLEALKTRVHASSGILSRLDTETLVQYISGLSVYLRQSVRRCLDRVEVVLSHIKAATSAIWWIDL